MTATITSQRRLSTTVVAFAAVCMHACTSTDAALPAGFSEDQMLPPQPGMGLIMQMVFLPDGRALLIDKAGTVFIAAPNKPGFPYKKYMKLDNVYDFDEVGLVSILISQKWAEGDKTFYLYWGHKDQSSEGMRISSFSHSENQGGLTSRGVPNSEKVLWHDKDGFPWTEDSDGMGYQGVLWHYGGKLQWGPDSHIYLTLGDKYMPNHAQRADKYSSCVIRITKDGQVPTGNLPDYVKPAECWAHGLRNGFASHWDLEPKGQERFLIAEVGGNNHATAQEDIHLGHAGDNYGWPMCEGSCNNTKFPACNCDEHDDPIYTYAHNGEEAAIIGGFVYRGKQLPEKYQGLYFYGDFVKKEIRTLKFTSDGSSTVESADIFSNTRSKPMDMVVDNEGSIWYIARPSWSFQVEIYRISYRRDTGNKAPMVTSAFASTQGGTPPFSATFYGMASDKDSAKLSYTWHFGDGTSANTAVAKHLYKEQGVFEARLYVSDGTTEVRSFSIPIHSGSKPNVQITSPAAGTIFKAGDAVKFAATAQDPVYGDLSENIEWRVEFVHKDHTHPFGTATVGAGGVLTIPQSGHGFEGETGFRLTATVTNPGRLQAEDSRDIVPDMVAVSLATSPAHLAAHVNIELDGEHRTTPTEFGTVPGFHHTLQAPTDICQDNSLYTFAGYSGIPRVCTKVNNLDYYGNDLPNMPVPAATFQSCSTACLANPACKVFSLTQVGDCYLKSAGDNKRGSAGPSGICPPLTATTTVPAKDGKAKFVADSAKQTTVTLVYTPTGTCGESTIKATTTMATTVAPPTTARATKAPVTTTVPTPAVISSIPLAVTSSKVDCSAAAWSNGNPSRVLCTTNDKYTARGCEWREAGARYPLGKCVDPVAEMSGKPCESLKWAIKPWRGSDTQLSCGKSLTGGKCMRDVTHTKAHDQCRSVGARLCRADELQADVALNTGCGLNRKAVWTSDRCNGGFVVAAGSSLEPIHVCKPASDTNTYAARCCADTQSAISERFPFASGSVTNTAPTAAKTCEQLGWKTKAGPGGSKVCAASRVRAKKNAKATLGCPSKGLLSFVAAEKQCAKIGARLCSAAELNQNVAKNTGCRLDKALVWTKDSCQGGGSMVAGGSSLAKDQPFCSAKGTARYSVRCCADATIQVGL